MNRQLQKSWPQRIWEGILIAVILGGLLIFVSAVFYGTNPPPACRENAACDEQAHPVTMVPER